MGEENIALLIDAIGLLGAMASIAGLVVILRKSANK